MILFNMFNCCCQQIYSVNKGKFVSSIAIIAIQDFAYLIFFMFSFNLYGMMCSV